MVQEVLETGKEELQPVPVAEPSKMVHPILSKSDFFFFLSDTPSIFLSLGESYYGRGER